MPAVLVAGHAGLDRIWQLDRPLRAGARLRCLRQWQRPGGGAANTAAALALLGATPQLAARIAADPAGDALLHRLAAHGLATTAIVRVPGATRITDILLSPDGERTLIGHGGGIATLPEGLAALPGEVAYVNFAALAEPAALRPLLARRWLVAQLPADPGEPRPAHALLASRSDIGDMPALALWQRRCALDAALRLLVITDGAAGAALIDATGYRAAPGLPAGAVTDSIGAGDFFAAGLLAALAEDAPPDAALARGQAAAARFLQQRPPAVA